MIVPFFYNIQKNKQYIIKNKDILQYVLLLKLIHICYVYYWSLIWIHFLENSIFILNIKTYKI